MSSASAALFSAAFGGFSLRGSSRNSCGYSRITSVHAVRHTFDPSRPFAPWLAAIARRRTIDRIRQVSRTRLRETALTEQHESLAFPETSPLVASVERRLLLRAVEALPAAQRQAVSLLKLHEMSLKEAAAASRRSVGALKVASHRAIFALKGSMRSQTDIA